jgi:hypothetical protein
MGLKLFRRGPDLELSAKLCVSEAIVTIPKRESSMGNKQQLLNFRTARLVVAIFGALIGMACSANSQTPADDVAAQVRSQGYECGQPVTATRNVKRSKADSAVWILKCRNAVYRVRLDPDMAARITKLRK